MDCQWIGWCAMRPEVQAAWVQAIGSILAIGVAIAVPAWQLSHQRKDQKDASVRHARSLASVLLVSATRFHENAVDTSKRAHEFASGTGDGEQFWVRIPSAILDARAELHLLGEPGGHLLRAIYYAGKVDEQADQEGYIWRERFETTFTALEVVVTETRNALDGMHALLR